MIISAAKYKYLELHEIEKGEKNIISVGVNRRIKSKIFTYYEKLNVHMLVTVAPCTPGPDLTRIMTEATSFLSHTCMCVT